MTVTGTMAAPRSLVDASPALAEFGHESRGIDLPPAR